MDFLKREITEKDFRRIINEKRICDPLQIYKPLFFFTVMAHVSITMDPLGLPIKVLSYQV
jgi:hypothetical protein